MDNRSDNVPASLGKFRQVLSSADRADWSAVLPPVRLESGFESPRLQTSRLRLLAVGSERRRRAIPRHRTWLLSTSSCPRMPLNATTSGFRPALAKDCKNTTLARIRQPLRTFLGDSQQLLAFLQNNEPDYSSDTLKVVQPERFLGVTCLIRSW